MDNKKQSTNIPATQQVDLSKYLKTADADPAEENRKKLERDFERAGLERNETVSPQEQAHRDAIHRETRWVQEARQSESFSYLD